MTTTQIRPPHPEAEWLDGDAAPEWPGDAKRQRIRGFRPKRVPSGNLLLQIGGLIAVLGGVFLLWGFAVTLLVGGTVSVILGTLREADLI